MRKRFSAAAYNLPPASQMTTGRIVLPDSVGKQSSLIMEKIEERLRYCRSANIAAAAPDNIPRPAGHVRENTDTLPQPRSVAEALRVTIDVFEVRSSGDGCSVHLSTSA